MRIRPDKTEKRSFKLPKVELPDWSIAVLLTAGYAFFLEFLMYSFTDGRTIKSGFWCINSIITAFIGWIPAMIAWGVRHDSRKRSRW